MALLHVWHVRTTLAECNYLNCSGEFDVSTDDVFDSPELKLAVVVALVQHWRRSRHLDDALEFVRNESRVQDGFYRRRGNLPPIHVGCECFVQLNLRNNLADVVLFLCHYDILWWKD